MRFSFEKQFREANFWIWKVRNESSFSQIQIERVKFKLRARGSEGMSFQKTKNAPRKVCAGKSSSSSKSKLLTQHLANAVFIQNNKKFTYRTTSHLKRDSEDRIGFSSAKLKFQSFSALWKVFLERLLKNSFLAEFQKFLRLSWPEKIWLGLICRRLQSSVYKWLLKVYI